MSVCANAINRFRSTLPSGLLAARPLWVAYSGGLDSTALLMACVQLGLPVRALHVNHHLQPAAGAMQAHCEQWCARHDIPLEVLHVEVARAGGDSLEACAREARYTAIGEAVSGYCTGNDCAMILTAHHRDDQIETLLMTLFRGSGLEGLAGMSQVASWPVAGFDALRLGRPLLDVARAALADEVAANAWHWFDDPTNTDTGLRRNWLRHEGLPAIRKQFPQVDASLLRLARQMGQAREEWQAEAARSLDECVNAEGALSRQAWAAMNAPRQLRVLRLWLSSAGLRLNEARTLELRDQLLRPQGGLRRVAPDWGVRLSGNWMQVVRDEQRAGG